MSSRAERGIASKCGQSSRLQLMQWDKDFACDFQNDWDHDWSRLTQASNAELENGRTASALAFYVQAHSAAENLLALAELSGHPVPAPASYNISCHNIAEIMHRVGDLRGAEQ